MSKRSLDIDVEKFMGSKGYLFLFVFRAFYKFITGGKGSGKSEAVERYALIKFLKNKNRHVVFLSKTRVKNESSTIPLIKQLIGILKDDFDLEDFSFDEKDSRFRYYPYPQSKIEDKYTGTFMFFKSMDQDSISSEKLSKKDHFIDTIVVEEIIDVNSVGVEESKIDDQFKWTVIEDSLLRTSPDHEKRLGAEQEVLFSNNAWNPNFWIMEEYVDKYVPYDREIMERDGKQVYYDPNYRKELGLLVVRTNYKLIKHLLGPETIRRMESVEGEEKDVIALGKTKPLENTVLAQSMFNLIPDIEEHTLESPTQFPLGIGIDWGLTRDATSAQLLTTNVKKIGSTTYMPAFDRANFFSIYYHSNKDVKDSRFKKTNKTMAKEIILKIVELLDLYPDLAVKKFPVLVDANNLPFLESLRDKQKEIEEETGMNLRWIVFKAQREKWRADARIGKRIFWWRDLMELEMCYIDPNNRSLLKGLQKSRFNQNTGQLIEKFDDAKNAAEYVLIRYLKQFKRNMYEKNRYEEKGLNDVWRF